MKHEYLKCPNLLTITTLILISSIYISCKKLVEIEPPPTNLAQQTVYSSNPTAIAVITGTYSQMIQSGSGFCSGSNSITAITGLSGDEFVNYAQDDPLLSQAYTNSLQSANVPFWAELYKYIYIVNAAIEGLTSSNGVTKDVKQQLIGEAKFLRAFYYFHLVNLFGDVPLLTSTDYQTNSSAARTPTTKVWNQIISDLQEAENLLSSDFLDGTVTASTNERTRPTKWAAKTLLARVYLYLDNWSAADSLATEVINNQTFKLAEDLNSVFLKNSEEAIWQLQPVSPQFNTFDGFYFLLWLGVPPPAYGISPFAISKNLISEFEADDLRLTNWVRFLNDNGQVYYYPYKYKVATGATVTEYLMVLRYAELFLIRAEARIHTGNKVGAIQDINRIRNRAGLPPTTANTESAILLAIEHERQLELFTEWGHRWFDLKRTKRIDAIMGKVALDKGRSWNPQWTLYPIPQSEINQNHNLLPQNPGY